MVGGVWGNNPRGPLATRSPALPDLDYDAAAYPSLDGAPADLHDAGQIDLAGHRGEFAASISDANRLSLPPPLQRTHHENHPDERHPAQAPR
jgi:hypothetical protein